MPGVKKVVRVGDSAVAVVADTWWQAKTALDAMPIEWDGGANAKVSSASIAAMLKEGLDAEQAFVHNQNGRREEPPSPARRKKSRRSTPIRSRTTPDGADERHRALHGRPLRGLVPDAERRGGARRHGRGLRPAGRPNATSHKLLLGGGFGRRGFTDFVRQAVLIAKEMPGTPVKLLWSREEDMLHGRYHPVMQAKLTGALDASGNLAGLHIRLSGQSILAAVRPDGAGQGQGPVRVPGLLAVRGALARIHDPESADRPCDAQHARAAGLLARREHQPERDLPRVLHGRARPCGRPGRARVPPQADGQASEVARGAERGGRKGRLGQAGARKGVHRGLAHFRAFGSYVAACAEISVSGRQQGEDPPHRRRHRLRATR